MLILLENRLLNDDKKRNKEEKVVLDKRNKFSWESRCLIELEKRRQRKNKNE